MNTEILRIDRKNPVEEGIEKYLGNVIVQKKHNDFTEREYDPTITGAVKVLSLDLINDNNVIMFGENLKISLTYEVYQKIEDLHFRFSILLPDRTGIATSCSVREECEENQKYVKRFEIDTSRLAPGDYIINLVAFKPSYLGGQIRHDCVPYALAFGVHNKEQLYNFEWDAYYWGHQVIPEAKEI